MNKYIQKWKKKSFFSKFSDIFFVIFLIAMLIPGPRKGIMAFVNNLKSKVIQPKVNTSNVNNLSEADFAWQLSDVEGNTVTLSDFKGKVIFINFWATWCGPCIGEMPEIQKFYDKFKDNDEVEFLIVTNENIDVIKNFIANKGYTFPVYSARGEVPKKLFTQTIPTSFLISKDGGIVLHKKGVANWGGEKMEESVNQLLTN